MTRILIIDDHPLVRWGLRELIEQEPELEVCGDVDSAAAGLEFVREKRPDLAIIDIKLADGDGIDLIKQFRAWSPGLKMVVCSMHEEKIYAPRALRAGAHGYVSKNDPPERVIEAIRRVLDDKLYLSAETSDHLLHVMSTRSRPGVGPGGQLSDRELEVFRFIGEGLTSREIAARLGLSIKTIDAHREHIKDKLNLRNATELIRYAVDWNIRAG